MVDVNKFRSIVSSVLDSVYDEAQEALDEFFTKADKFVTDSFDRLEDNLQPKDEAAQDGWTDTDRQNLANDIAEHRESLSPALRVNGSAWRKDANKYDLRNLLEVWNSLPEKFKTAKPSGGKEGNTFNFFNI